MAASSSSCSSWISSHCHSTNCAASELKLGSCKLISDSFPSKTDYEEEDVRCFCGLKSLSRCSWIGSNPKRRFYGCQKYPWHDEIFSSQVVEVINELRVREKFLYEQARGRVSNKSYSKFEDFVIRENEQLRNELEGVKRKFERRSTIQCVTLNCFLMGLVFALLGYVICNK